MHSLVITAGAIRELRNWPNSDGGQIEGDSNVQSGGKRPRCHRLFNVGYCLLLCVIVCHCMCHCVSLYMLLCVIVTVYVTALHITVSPHIKVSQIQMCTEMNSALGAT